MNRLTIIGNLTKDPELRVTQNGTSVCSFTVAVSRKGKNERQEADYFRVSAWRELGENCSKYLLKGRKVAVIGPVSAKTYQTQQGETRASLEITAYEVEFLTPKREGSSTGQEREPEPQEYTVVEGEELPF